MLVIVGAAVGIMASAAETSASAESQPSTPIPKIVSKNLSYSSQLYIYFAIPASDVPDGAEISLRLYDGAPDAGGRLVKTADRYSIETIETVEGDPDHLYYVFTSQGIAARGIGEYVYAVPVLTIGEEEILGVTEKYSVAEYCYDRLYNQDFISKTSNDGMDYDRKQLYIALLEYGSAAQLHFGGAGVTPATDYCYYNFSEVLVADESGFCTAGGTVTVAHDGTSYPGEAHAGWKVTYYDANNVKTVEEYRGDEYLIMSITFADKATLVEPIFELVDPYLKQVAIDEAMLAQEWADFEEKAGKELTDAFKQIHALFGDEIVDWSASLYAPGYSIPEIGYYAGGYYAAVSGRDNLGFGPDLESTDQMLRFIVNSGMLDHAGISSVDDLGQVLPEWMQQQIIYFVKSMQAPDGYFYHPQWPVSDHSDRRLGRDLEWATSMLKRFGSAPQYDTPNGKKGNGQSAAQYFATLGYSSLYEANGIAVSAPLTMSLRASATTAVYGVMLVAESDDGISNAVTSHANLATWLETKIKLDVNPYTYGDQLNSVYGQIKTASAGLGAYESPVGTVDEPWYEGMTLMEMTLAYIESFIDPETGLIDDGWREYNASLDAAGDTTTRRKTGYDFIHTNGLLKTYPVFHNWGYKYPYAEEAIESVLKGILGDESTDKQITDLYNLWMSLVGLKNNLKLYGTAEEYERASAYIASVLAEDGVFAVTNTYEKLSRFKKSDGGFNSGVNSSAGAGEKCPTTLGVSESFCDATNIAMSTMRNIYSAFGYGSIPFFTESDWMRYLDILESNKPVAKGDFNDAMYDFSDSQIPPYVSAENGSLSVSSGELVLSSANAAAFTVDRHYICTVGKIIRFAADMKFDTVGEYKLTLNTADGKAASFTVKVEANQITLTDDVSATSFTAAATLGQKVAIKLETAVRYNSTDEKYYTMTEAFLGGEYRGFISSFSEADGYERIAKLTEIESATLATPNGGVAFDNLIFVIGNSSAPCDFEQAEPFEKVGSSSVTSGSITATLSPRQNTEAKMSVINDGSNTFLRVDNRTSQTGDLTLRTVTLTCNAPTVNSNALVFETKIRLNHTNYNASGRGWLEFNLDTAANGAKPWAIRLHTETANYVEYIYSYPDGKTGAAETTTFTRLGLAYNEWFTLKVIVETDDSNNFKYTAYINNTEIGTSTTPYNRFADASEIVRFVAYPESGWQGTIDIDDVSFSQYVEE